MSIENLFSWLKKDDLKRLYILLAFWIYIALFFELDIKLIDRNFQVGLFDEGDSFPFSIARTPETSSNVPDNIVYSATGADYLQLPWLISPAIKLVITTSNIGYYCYADKTIMQQHRLLSLWKWDSNACLLYQKLKNT